MKRRTFLEGMVAACGSCLLPKVVLPNEPAEEQYTGLCEIPIEYLYTPRRTVRACNMYLCSELAEHMEKHGQLMPLTVFGDKRGAKWFYVLDGIHRLHVARKLGYEKMVCQVITLDKDEMYAVSYGKDSQIKCNSLTSNSRAN